MRWIYNFTLKEKSLLDYANLVSPIEYEKNGKIKIPSISRKVIMRKTYSIICGNLKKSKTLQYHTFSKNISSFYYIQWMWQCGNEDEKIFKEEESIQVLKILVLIEKYISTLKIWLKRWAKNLDWIK